MAFCIVAAFCMIVAISVMFPVALIAYADDEVQEPEEVTEVEEKTETPVVVIETPKEEEDSLAKVFKENILPYIVSAGSSILALMIVLAPYIKERGKNKTLQGMYTVASKTMDTYKTKLSEYTVDGVVDKIAQNIIPGLQEFILSTVKEAVKENVTDTTGDITKLQSNMDVISAQLTNFIRAALITWGDIPAVREILAKAPTAETLNDYLAKFKELKAAVDGQNAEAIKPIEDAIKELEGYGNENE